METSRERARQRHLKELGIFFLTLLIIKPQNSEVLKMTFSESMYERATPSTAELLVTIPSNVDYISKDFSD